MTCQRERFRCFGQDPPASPPCVDPHGALVTQALVWFAASVVGAFAHAITGCGVPPFDPGDMPSGMRRGMRFARWFCAVDHLARGRRCAPPRIAHEGAAE